MGVVVLLVILGVVAVIALVAFIIYKYTHPKLLSEQPDEKETLQEEMDRILQPIEDEDLRKKVEEYQEKDD